MRRSRVIQIMFDTKSGGWAQRLYVSKITCECDGRRIFDASRSGKGAYFPFASHSGAIQF